MGLRIRRGNGIGNTGEPAPPPPGGRSAPRSSSGPGVLSSLRGRLLFLVCLATLPAVLFTFFLATREKARTLARIEDEARHLALIATREHMHQIEGAAELLRWLGERAGTEEIGNRIVTDPAFLSALLAGHPQLANMGVLSPEGSVISSVRPLPTNRSWTGMPVFARALEAEGVVVGTYGISPIFDRPTLNQALAVRDEQGGVSSVLFTGLDLSWLSELARRSDLGEEFSLLITDREGQVLAGADRANPSVEGLQGSSIPDLPAIARSGKGRALEMPETGLRRYLVARPLMGTGSAGDLFVVAGLPYEQVLQETTRAFLRTLGAVGLLTLFTATAVFVAAELAVLRALRSLAATARRLGDGDLNARAATHGGYHELASLGRTFNVMADALSLRHRETVEARERLRALANRLNVAREAEAARISRELHDEIGQVLTSLRIDLARLQHHCEPDEAGKAISAEINRLNVRIEEAIHFVRRISAELRPGVLDRLGLIPALQWQARETESRTDLVVQVEAEEIAPPPDELVSVTLFRIAQEALTNVVRHAGARVVELSLVKEDGAIVLAVGDDGRGISDASAGDFESLGLIGMQERAMLIGGTLQVKGMPGRGTTVTVRIPHPTEAGTGVKA